jgi:NAD(P)H-hydrate epimerase
VSWPVVARSVVPTVTAAEMREVDEQARTRFGLLPIQLMEAAGLQIARFVGDWLGGLKARRIWVLCGPGNNGGDALVTARHLHARGAAVTITAVEPRPGAQPSLMQQQREIAQKIGLRFEGRPQFETDLVVDGLLGTGSRLPPRGEVATLIGAALREKCPVIAVDLPSGLDADTGIASEPCIRATATFTLGLPKPGLLQSPLTGRLFLANIGIPPGLFSDPAAVEATFQAGDLVELT